MENEETAVILLVEDDPAHAEIAMRNFRKKLIGTQIVHLTDGQQALDYLLRQGTYSDPESSPRPKLVLLDLRLPKVDGLEVLQRIRSSEKIHNLPVVVLTTSGAESDISRAYDYNVNSYLVKPMDFNKFSNLIESFSFYWGVWNKYPFV